MCEDGRHAAKKFGVRDEPRIDGNAACVRNRPGPPVGNRSSPYGGRRPPTHLPLLHLPRRKLATNHRSRLLQIKNAPSQARLTRSSPPRLLSYAGTTRSFFYLPHLSFRRVSLVEEKSRIRDPSTSHRPTLGMTSGLTPFRRIPLRPVPCELEECANRVGNLLASQHNRENARLI